MEIKEPSLLDLTEAQSDIEAWQKAWSKRVQRTGERPAIRRIASADVAYSEQGDRAFAGLVVLEWPSQRLLERHTWCGDVAAEYESGAFSLREAPCLLEVFRQVETPPDVILIDGHGWMHPRRFGLACHLGLALAVPTFGVAKTPLLGDHGELGPLRGSTAWIVDTTEALPSLDLPSDDPRILGAALRTQDGIKPVYVSVGHGLSLEACIQITLSTAPTFRLPEPLRAAHLLSIQLRKAHTP